MTSLALDHPNPQHACFYCGETMRRHRQAVYCFECLEKRGSNRAVQIVNSAVRAGQLPRPRSLLCVDCGARAHAYDHRDYSRPLVVEPVCRSCNWRRGPAKAAIPMRPDVFGKQPERAA